MTFLNATLIFGMAAAVVPIVLHLIARREPRKVVFPSIRFLSKRFESNRSRLRVRRWWLLALRILAVVALAMALARPAIHGSLSLTWMTIAILAALGIGLLALATLALSRGLSRNLSVALSAAAVVALLSALIWGGYTYASGPAPAIDTIGPVAMAIVLDNSPTAAWQTPGDDRITRMQQLASWMVTRLPRTSRVAIVDRSPQPVTFLLDTASALTKIEQLTPRQVTAPLAARLDAAARLLRTSDLENRQILLVTDLAASSWDESMTEASLAETFSADPPVQLTVFDLGEMSAANRALSIPQLGDATPPQKTPVAISTRLQLAGNSSGNPMSVTAELQMYDNDPGLPVIRDGSVSYPALRSVDRTSVRIGSADSYELLMTIPALPIGTHHGLVRLVGDDAMPLDDVRYFSLQVLPPADVLLVSDDPDEARIISGSITATALPSVDSNPEFSVQRIAFTDFSVVRLSDFDAVLLLDPPGEVLQDEGLSEFARNGGGVLICLGPTAGDAALQTPLIPPLLRRWRAPDPGTFFQVRTSSHPVTDALASDTPWADFRVNQYWQMQPADGDAVLIDFAGTDHPALVQRTFAATEGTTSGRVLVLATPLPALSGRTRPWNDLFGIDPWPAWLLIRQAIEYLTHRGSGEAMSMVGTAQTIALEETSPAGEELGSGEERAQRYQLFPPGGAAPIPLDVAAASDRLVVSETPTAGTYWLRGGPPAAGFSVNLPAAATQTQRIDPAQLDVIFGPDQFTLVDIREKIDLAENQATARVSLESPAMLLALVIFLLEQLLGNRFYRSEARPLARARLT